ncbi:hypothetical protein BDBG_17269 [Blastomyces gilchristii SLH14081]|uniref:Protein kinase domain-containing protein n=1 Tax=Blastomyces gilchristii (strain SLH14081) TaxID=559298 RepID=A0A179URR4_BLAGS|nr:uncharacterized protein BDBG_17269 [Blastomyces gilchristii SLH14081]OAT09757.1 hypothetical protein BDBG_17269 [Blastomyces gilchristii SLH14081]
MVKALNRHGTHRSYLYLRINSISTLRTRTGCLPHLNTFVKDEYQLTAILLEYILKMKELNWINYNERRMQNFVDELNRIHDTLVYHNDVHPRNMMIVEEDPERTI